MKEITTFEGARDFFSAYNQGLKDMQEFTCKCGGEINLFDTDAAGNRTEKCETCGELYHV